MMRCIIIDFMCEQVNGFFMSNSEILSKRAWLLLRSTVVSRVGTGIVVEICILELVVGDMWVIAVFVGASGTGTGVAVIIMLCPLLYET